MGIWKNISDRILFPKHLTLIEWIFLPGVSPFVRVEFREESSQLQEYCYTTAVGVSTVRQPLSPYAHARTNQKSKC